LWWPLALRLDIGSQYMIQASIFRKKELKNKNIFCLTDQLSWQLLLLVWWGVEPNWVHSALRPLIGLLCQPWVIMIKEKLVERLAGETEVLWENLPQCCFVHRKPHMLPRREPGPPWWEASY
jgi:hypothetical protein